MDIHKTEKLNSNETYRTIFFFKKKKSEKLDKVLRCWYVETLFVFLIETVRTFL